LLQLADGSGGSFTCFNLHPRNVYMYMLMIKLKTQYYLGDEFRSLQVKLRDGVLQLLDLSITLRNNHVPEYIISSEQI
jgi:hypothetical protein